MGNSNKDEYIENLEAFIVDLCHDCGFYDFRKISDVSDERICEMIKFYNEVFKNYKKKRDCSG